MNLFSKIKHLFGGVFVLHVNRISASAKDPDYGDMAYIYCVGQGNYCLSLSRPPGERLIEVMVVDQVNHRTAEVAAELHREKLTVRLSPSAASKLDHITVYEARLNRTDDELDDIDRALSVIFAEVGDYTRHF